MEKEILEKEREEEKNQQARSLLRPSRRPPHWADLQAHQILTLTPGEASHSIPWPDLSRIPLPPPPDPSPRSPSSISPSSRSPRVAPEEETRSPIPIPRPHHSAATKARAPPTSLRRQAPAPRRRSASCRLAPATSAPRQAPPPCPITDGDHDQHLRLPDAEASPPSPAYALGTRRTPSSAPSPPATGAAAGCRPITMRSSSTSSPMPPRRSAFT